MRNAPRQPASSDIFLRRSFEFSAAPPRIGYFRTGVDGNEFKPSMDWTCRLTNATVLGSRKLAFVNPPSTLIVNTLPFSEGNLRSRSDTQSLWLVSGHPPLSPASKRGFVSFGWIRRHNQERREAYSPQGYINGQTGTLGKAVGPWASALRRNRRKEDSQTGTRD